MLEAGNACRAKGGARLPAGDPGGAVTFFAIPVSQSLTNSY
jgi:hypothetical protein